MTKLKPHLRQSPSNLSFLDGIILDSTVTARVCETYAPCITTHGTRYPLLVLTVSSDEQMDGTGLPQRPDIALPYLLGKRVRDEGSDRVDNTHD